MWLSVTSLILSHPPMSGRRKPPENSFSHPSQLRWDFVGMCCGVRCGQLAQPRNCRQGSPEDAEWRSVWGIVKPCMNWRVNPAAVYFFIFVGGVQFYIGTSPCFEGYTSPNWKVTADGSFHGDIFVTENCCFVTLFPNAPWIIKGMMEWLTRQPKTKRLP